MAQEYTAKFKVDISDLKKNISEANQQIKLANATFKAETAGMEKWSDNAEGLGAKLKQLDSQLTNQKKVLSAYEQELNRKLSRSADSPILLTTLFFSTTATRRKLRPVADKHSAM